MLRITVVKHWEYRVMHDLLIRLVAWADKTWILRQTLDLFRDIQSCWRVTTISFNTTKMLLRTCRSEIAVLIALGLIVTACGANAGGEPTLWNIQKVIASKKYVDLTHDFSPGIPRWPGFPDETRKTIYWYDKRPDTLGSGFFSELFTHVGQWGTHVDPPAHFVKGLRTVDQIDPKEMILPLVVIDVHREAVADPDYTLSLERVKKLGKRSRPNSDGSICSDAHGLVETLARRSKNGKQRREGRGTLSRMESASAEIPI